MGISKLIWRGQTLLDLTDVSVTSDNLYEDTTAHGIDGESVLGAASTDHSVEDSIVDGSIISYENNELTSLGGTDAASTFRNCTQLQYVSLPSVSILNGYNFYNCTSLTSVNLPALSSLTVNGYQFYNCTSLPNLNFLNSNIKYLPLHCFDYCRSLEAIDLPNVATTTQYVFRGCTSASYVYMPNLTNIGAGGYQFSGCTALTSVFIGTSGGTHCFDGDTVLVSAVLTGSVKMNSYSFQGCTKLEIVDLNTTQMDNREFYNCSSLKTIILRNSSVVTMKQSPTTSNTCWYNTAYASGGAGGTIYVPEALLESYPTATNWSILDGYGTISWLPIEGSIYENYYANGAAIT